MSVGFVPPPRAIDAAIRAYYQKEREIFGSQINFDKFDDATKEKVRACWREALRAYTKAWLG